MRVLYVIDSLISGGAETSLAHMAPAYRDIGLELHVAFLRDRWHVAEALRDAGATLHPVHLDAGRIKQFGGLVRLIRQLNPDVVHTTLWEADVLGRTAATIARRPVVTTLANSSYSPAERANPDVRRWKLDGAQALDVATARMASAFHAVSEQVATDMSRALRIPRARIVVVPRARRRDLLGERTDDRREAARSRLGISHERPLVLAVGRHEHQKGLDVLVDAASALRDLFPGVLVAIAGRDGRASAALRLRITELGLDETVQVLGERADVPELIVAADVLAVPSRVEGMPGAVLEAMALGTPVVASDIPMVREAIGDHAAGLVPVGDAGALAAALHDVLTDPAGTQASVTVASRRFDERFTPEVVVAAMAEIYEGAVSRWGGRRSLT